MARGHGNERQWSAKELRQIGEARRRGASVEKLRKEFKAGDSAIRNALNQLGNPLPEPRTHGNTRQWTSAELRAIAREYKKGDSIPKLRKKHHAGDGAILNALRLTGTPLRSEESGGGTSCNCGIAGCKPNCSNYRSQWRRD